MANTNGATMAKAQESEAPRITNVAEATAALSEGRITAEQFAEMVNGFAIAAAKASVQSASREPSITGIEYVAPGSPTRRGNGQTVYPKLLVRYKATPNASESEVFLNVAVWNALLRSDELKAQVKAHS